MKVTGKMISRMALERRSGIMEQRPMKENLLMAKSMERVNSHGVMVRTMTETL